MPRSMFGFDAPSVVAARAYDMMVLDEINKEEEKKKKAKEEEEKEKENKTSEL